MNSLLFNSESREVADMYLRLQQRCFPRVAIVYCPEQYRLRHLTDYAKAIKIHPLAGEEMDKLYQWRKPEQLDRVEKEVAGILKFIMFASRAVR